VFDSAQSKGVDILVKLSVVQQRSIAQNFVSNNVLSLLKKRAESIQSHRFSKLDENNFQIAFSKAISRMLSVLLNQYHVNNMAIVW
jgi:hypothetical protein